MNEPTRRGRRPQRFAIRRIRLVGFHNFVDETIELPEGGHLFLLGDNGSGKTTVLDAIHLVLTGAQGVELNAAARVAGGRDGGRTLQGIVLRYDAERGVVNEGGAIGYVALELVDDTEPSASREGAALVMGVGVEATTMEADVTRWGFLTRRRLEDVPVVEATLAGNVPLSRDALRTKLGKLDVFAKMSDFRRAIAERLFGSIVLYEEVCRFWSTAKAYREIVTKARDFAGLFARMLPAPNRETFTEILKSARALDELEDTLKQLEEQRGYVASVAELASTIRSLREATARYRWLHGFRRLGDARAELAATSVALERRERDLRAESAEVERARGTTAVASAALAAAQAADPEGLGAKIRAAEAQQARDRGELARASAEAEDARAHAGESRSRLGATRRARRELFGRLVHEARSVLERVRTVDAPLGAVHAALDAEEARVPVPPNACARDSDEALEDAPLPPIDPVVRKAATDVAAAAAATLRLREQDEAACKARVDASRAELALLESRGEELPLVSGFIAAREALARAGITARPLYELLDPKPTASGAALAAIEALAGDEALAAFVVPEAERERARAIVVHLPGARLFLRAAAGEELPAWICDLFSARSEGDALAGLATLLAQPAVLGTLAAPDALGDLEHRGEALRAHRESPRLLGELARQRAHEARVHALRAEIERVERLATDAASARETAARVHEHAAELVDRLGALRSQPVIEAQFAVIAAGREVVRALRDVDVAEERLRDAASRAQESEDLVAALAARARDAGLEEIERRIAELRDRDRRAREAEQAALRRHAGVEAEVANLAAARARHIEHVARLEEELASRAAALRARLEAPFDDQALEHYVRVTQRGDQFKSVAHIEERLHAADREEGIACSEIGGDGSRGVRCLAFAGRFGFTFHSADCKVEDRRGEPLASVLAQIERTIADQREVVNERTRELMDRLVMGALARELQEHVERLQRTVREMNLLLEDRRFGTTRYRFKVTPRADRAELVSLVRSMSLLDDESRARFRQFVDEQLEDLRRLDDDTDVPELLDYRRWFDYRLSMRSSAADPSAVDGDTELTRELRALGSGGEQGVPNYLLVLALARLVFDTADARLRPLLFDEAFYGIDAGRRDELLRFATDLGLQIVVASPDQDGVTPGVRRTTTLFLVKDQTGDVHLAPYHYWNDAHVAQRSLLPERPNEPALEDAVCVLAPE